MILKIVSVGPGDPSLMNAVTEASLRSAGILFLRTGRHPISSWLISHEIPFRTMDDLYESSDDFDTLSESMASRLWEAASVHENTVYAVSDTMTDHTVDTVFSALPRDCCIEIVPGFSFADFYLPRCRHFFSTADIRICPASSFCGSGYDPSRPVLITELNDAITAGEVKNFLSSFIRDEEKVIFMNGNNAAVRIPLFELDRQPVYDHLSAVAAGSFSYAQRNRKTLDDLMCIMDRLRSADGCPWDRAQTHDSLKPYVIEEAWEVVDAIQENDPDHLAEELGDLLFQVVFHASVGQSYDEFSMDDILEAICGKMIRRHPHVFGSKEKGKPSESFSEESWDQIKQSETGSVSAVESLRDVSESLPSLRYAEKIIRKMKQIPGMPDLSGDEIVTLIHNSAADISSDSLGVLLFFCAYFAQQQNTDSEVLLHQKVKKIIQACESLEKNGKISLDSPKPLTFNDLGVY